VSKVKLAVIAATLPLLASCITISPSSSDKKSETPETLGDLDSYEVDSDTAYNALIELAPSFRDWSRTNLETLAEMTCDELSLGIHPRDIYQGTMDAGFTFEESVGSLMYSVTGFCPEHSSSIDQWIDNL
jgi:hypothetical protein